MLTDKQKEILKEPIDIKRHYKKWNMNEINRLHNEYEIKELTIRQIAKLHNRTYLSILYKLASEGLISENWSEARGCYEITG
jgi:DNA-binding PadR family transcriptional regulator